MRGNTVGRAVGCQVTACDNGCDAFCFQELNQDAFELACGHSPVVDNGQQAEGEADTEGHGHSVPAAVGS